MVRPGRAGSPDNYLDLVVERRVSHETLADGRIVLLRPKFMKGPLARWLQPRLGKPFFRVRLDEIGQAAWEAIDGHRTVGEIADLLGERFGDRVEPRHERCASFVRALERGAMVALREKGVP